MAANWTDERIFQLEAQFAEAGVAMHARPLRAAMEILRGEFVFGAVDNPEVNRVIKRYRALLPSVDQAWPGKGIGLVASVDNVRKVTVAVIYGAAHISIHDGLGFDSHEGWARWCRGNLSIAACSAYAFADLYDLTYGIDIVSGEAALLWHMALCNLEDVANILSNGFSVDSVIQPICLTAELSLKGALISLGADQTELARKVGHNVEELARRLADLSPHRDDALIARVAASLPNYVQSRYSATGLTRLGVVKRALGVQFIAASAARRVGDRDMAADMERDEFPGPRNADWYI